MELFRSVISVFARRFIFTPRQTLTSETGYGSIPLETASFLFGLSFSFNSTCTPFIWRMHIAGFYCESVADRTVNPPVFFTCRMRYDDIGLLYVCLMFVSCWRLL